MGAITRAAANNITTGGIILPAGINDASVASITALAQVSAGDGITLISSQTGSGASAINFTSGIDSTYRTYLFKIINLKVVGDDNMSMVFNLSTDGGSNYNVTKTTTCFRTYNFEADTGSSLAYDSGGHLAQSTGYQILHVGGLGGDADQSLSGELYLFNPSSTTYVKHFLLTTSTVGHNDAMLGSYIAGYGNTTSAINAVTFYPSSGTLNATIHMYGIA